MQVLRPPALAGCFYPDDATALEHQVQALLDAAPANTLHAGLKALISPHAGYMYSGRIAAAAYAPLAHRKISRVVLIGPSHHVRIESLALPEADGFMTPLGNVELDQSAMTELLKHPGIVRHAMAHSAEHSLEVQLPFLQVILKDFTLIPLVAGFASATTIADALEILWGGSETLIVVSSDLSHYQSDKKARALDQETIHQILKLSPLYSDNQACGAVSINGLLLAAQRHHLKPYLLACGNSSEMSGDKKRVVGYAAIGFVDEQVHE